MAPRLIAPKIQIYAIIIKMAQISRIFLNGSYYHVFNRGVEKRTIFLDIGDYRHFLRTIGFYQQAKMVAKLSKSDFDLTQRSPDLLFEIIAYCLMPNHFHLLIKQTKDGGVQKGMSNILNSFTRYFNTKHTRVGPLFQGNFKSVPVLTDEQFLHVVRYVLLNPFAGGITDNPKEYEWSSFDQAALRPKLLCNFDDLNSYFKSKEELETFILDYADYARNLELIKHSVLD